MGAAGGPPSTINRQLHQRAQGSRSRLISRLGLVSSSADNHNAGPAGVGSDPFHAVNYEGLSDVRTGLGDMAVKRPPHV